MTSVFTRRALLGTSLASVAAAGIRRPAEAIQADEPCLEMATFPVGAGEHPHDVAPAAEGGGIWYTAQHTAALGLFDPATGAIELVPLGENSAPHGVIVGPDGAAWVTDGGRDEIQRVDAASKEVLRFPIGVTGANLNTCAIDADGAVWYTGQNGYVGRLDPESGEAKTVEAPRGRGPYGICATPEGEIWFVSLAGSYLGRLAFAGGQIEIETFDPPTAGAGCRRVWSDSTGRLWIAEWDAGQVASFDPMEGAWQEWRLPGPNPQAYAVYVDDQDIVWLTDFGGDAIVRFDPAFEEFTPLPLPDAGGAVRQLLGRPGELWGAESAVDKLILVRTACA